MMVIRRKIGQSFHIGDDIRITVQDIENGKSVRFGIQAPVEIPVHRLEVYERIQKENRASSSGDTLKWLNGVPS